MIEESILKELLQQQKRATAKVDALVLPEIPIASADLILQLPALRFAHLIGTHDGSSFLDFSPAGLDAVDAGGTNPALIAEADGITYLELDGTAAIKIADAAGVRVTMTESYVAAASNGITLGAWVYFNNAAGSSENIVSKKQGAAASQMAYLIQRNTTGYVRFQISNGLAIDNLDSTIHYLDADTWYHVVGSIDVDNGDWYIWVNGVEDSGTTSLTSLTTSDAADLHIGGRDTGTTGTQNCVDGKLTRAFLAAAYTGRDFIQRMFAQECGMFGY